MTTVDLKNRPDARALLRDFIADNFYVAGGAAALDDEASLIESGVIDSTGVLEVIEFLERSFGIHVEDGEMRPENLDSVARLCAYVARKQA